jgi:hypothetical protein
MRTAISIKTRPGSATLKPRGLGLGCAWLAWLLASVPLLPQNLPRFREQVISKEVKFGYQLIAVDVNGDGRPDIAAIGASTANVKLYVNLGKK